MRVRMLETEAGRLYPAGPNRHFLRYHTYDVPGAIGGAWEEQGIAYPVPSDLADDLPGGYRLEAHGGGYYNLTAPDGSAVEGPENGRWRGKDGAVTAAHQHDARHDFADALNTNDADTTEEEPEE